MKKVILSLIVLAVAVFAGYKIFFKKENQPEEKKDQPLAVSKSSDAVNASFFILMNDYYAVKDALVDWDSTKANQAASVLQHYVDSLPLKDLKADTNVIATAQNFASSISSEAIGLIKETTIEKKRRSLNMLTDEVYNLIRTVKYDGAVVFHERCPMAFNDSEEGYWLSNSSKIQNPYLGNKHPKYKSKMVECGEVVDSVDFVKK
jgi:uncharacterized protein DUF3347